MHAFARIAATVAVALAAAMAASCTTPGGLGTSSSSGATTPGGTPSSTTATGTSAGGATGAPAGTPAGTGGSALAPSVPRYYLMVDPASPARLIVRATATAAVVTTVTAPHGFVYGDVFGSGTGQAFLVTTRTSVPMPGGGQNLYLLRLTSGSPVKAVLTRLPLPGGLTRATAVALSPDASKVAVAFTVKTSPPVQQPLEVYSTLTGALLRTWWVTGGMVTSAPQSGSADYVGQPSVGTSLRWLPDGRRIAFAYDSASIRLLDTTATGKPAAGMAPDGTKAQGSDLLGSSVEMISLGPAYNPGNGPSFRCFAAGGWSVAADGCSVTCASELNAPGFSRPAGDQPASCADRPRTGASQGPATGQLPGPKANLGFTRYIGLAGQAGGINTLYVVCATTAPASVHLGWASPDGTMVLGALGYQGRLAFGLFSAGAFHPLPPPPAGVKLTSIAW